MQPQQSPDPSGPPPQNKMPGCTALDLQQFELPLADADAQIDDFLTVYTRSSAAGSFDRNAVTLTISTQDVLGFENIFNLPPDTGCLGVRISYGLEEAAGDAPVFVFSHIAMEEESVADGRVRFTLGDPGTYYIYDGAAWQQKDAAYCQEVAARYALVMRKGNPPAPLIIDPNLGDASDPSSGFFTFYEFQKLIEQNTPLPQAPAGNEEGGETTAVEGEAITAIGFIWSTGIYGSDPQYKQRVVLYPVWKRVAQPSHPAGPLTGSAANFIEMCPPQCRVVDYAVASTSQHRETHFPS